MILVKDAKAPATALQMRVAAKSAEQARRTKSWGRLNLFICLDELVVKTL
jgi:hypothetical protein